MASEGDNVSVDLLRAQLARANAANEAHLKQGGGGGTFDGMDIVDAKIAAAEARTDTKFAELMGELKAIERSTAGTKATVVVTGLTAVAIVVAIFGWGTSMFSTGMDAQTVADRAAVAVEQRLAGQLQTTSAKYEDMAGRLDAISLENSERWAEVLEAIKQPSAP